MMNQKVYLLAAVIFLSCNVLSCKSSYNSIKSPTEKDTLSPLIFSDIGLPEEEIGFQFVYCTLDANNKERINLIVSNVYNISRNEPLEVEIKEGKITYHIKYAEVVRHNDNIIVKFSMDAEYKKENGSSETAQTQTKVVVKKDDFQLVGKWEKGPSNAGRGYLRIFR